jgi:ribosome-associated heat shock protein Hsp15
LPCAGRIEGDGVEGQRLDKWLWCARLVKTRTLSATLIAAGKIRVNGERVRKAARHVIKDDIITASLGRLVVVRVLGSVERRVAASLARTLYQDLTPPPVAQQEKPVGAGKRPTKRDRRRLDAFVSQGSEG